MSLRNEEYSPNKKIIEVKVEKAYHTKEAKKSNSLFQEKEQAAHGGAKQSVLRGAEKHAEQPLQKFHSTLDISKLSSGKIT